jgi:hypothetical protein
LSAGIPFISTSVIGGAVFPEGIAESVSLAPPQATRNEASRTALETTIGPFDLRDGKPDMRELLQDTRHL